MRIGVLVLKDNGIMYAMWYDWEFTFPEHPAVEQFLSELDESFGSLGKLLVAEEYTQSYPERVGDILTLDYPEPILWADGDVRGTKTLTDAIDMIDRYQVENRARILPLFQEFDESNDQAIREDIADEILAWCVIRGKDYVWEFEVFEGSVWLLPVAKIVE